jgi:hypothetical protein
METEKYNISTGTYCGHNCIWWRWFYYALSDSYPVTWLTKVVALLPPVADSLALYGLCGLALPSIRIGEVLLFGDAFL